MTWRITPNNLLVDDPDAMTYLAAVEAADGQALESGVRLAVNAFVKGCKADGIWPAIKASCILAGARTLNGALVPLTGTAPTNFNFVAGDYNRKTGLIGDGTTKYLNSNRNNNADPQNSQHLGVYVSAANSLDVNRGYIGCGLTNSGSSHIFTNTSPSPELLARSRSSSSSVLFPGSASAVGFIGKSRASGSDVSLRCASTSALIALTSESPLNQSIVVFGRNNVAQANARLAFYSIGEAINLSQLDARITALINALAAAIP